ncbi:MAG: hypothetical protein ACI9VT_002052 [Psychroserpens sp.]|jgi:hypothetical protein
MILIYSNTSAKTIFIWPNRAKAAIILAYDDALNSQLDHALPVLNKLKVNIPGASPSANAELTS